MDFWPNFDFLVKISIFDRISTFWSKFQFLTEFQFFGQTFFKHRIFVLKNSIFFFKISLFSQKIHFFETSNFCFEKFSCFFQNLILANFHNFQEYVNLRTLDPFASSISRVVGNFRMSYQSRWRVRDRSFTFTVLLRKLI